MSANGWLPIEGAPKGAEWLDFWVAFSEGGGVALHGCYWSEADEMGEAGWYNSGGMIKLPVGETVTHYRIEKGPHA